MFFSFSTSKGELKQSLSSIESGQDDVEKYGRFISQDAAMKRILRLNEDAPKKERTERLLKKPDWDIGASEIIFNGNPQAGQMGECNSSDATTFLD